MTSKTSKRQQLQTAGEEPKTTKTTTSTTTTTTTTAADFTSYYLQQSTKEFAEDLDKIRSADDFKGDALPMLIRSLQQGTSLFTAADQKRIVDARKAAGAEKRDGDDDGEDEPSSSSDS